MSLSTTKITAAINGSLSGAVGFTAPSVDFSKVLTDTLTDGTAIDQANKVYAASLSLTTSPTQIDFSGALTDPLGNTIVFTKIKTILIVNKTTTAGAIINVGGDAAAVSTIFGAANDLVKIGPDGFFLLHNPSLAGYAVTATTADILALAMATGTGTCDILVLGL